MGRAEGAPPAWGCWPTQIGVVSGGWGVWGEPLKKKGPLPNKHLELKTQLAVNVNELPAKSVVVYMWVIVVWVDKSFFAVVVFQEILGMTREDYTALPSWKQSTLKKDKGLFWAGAVNSTRPHVIWTGCAWIDADRTLTDIGLVPPLLNICTT